ncbi:heparan N-sulfatase [Bacteroidia bacterium]|nr:heparan N-sulfatase [Bacteroidia bacterium]GHV22940.1 heparan N-sulfatase [Bacteroidia bacterium]
MQQKIKKIILGGAFFNSVIPSVCAQPENIGSNNLPLNVVLITADDLNYSSVGYMGCGVQNITPNLDKLASQSMLFQNAYVNIAVSQPSRAVLATGLYAHNNGVEGFYHTDRSVPTIMSVLKENGYTTGIAGKLPHSTPKNMDDWDTKVDQPELGDGRDPQRYYDVFNSFVKRAKEQNKPFYFMANSHDPHRPFHGSDEEHRTYPEKNFPDASRVYLPDEVIVPAFIPDLPDVRLDLSQYYSSVRRLDDMVGRILEVVAENNLEDNTIIMFLSDNGMDFPFAKTNCYFNSNKTPWIVKWPKKIKEGCVDSEHFISTIDFMPTILEACNVKSNVKVDGKSFVPLLKGEKQANRDRVYIQFHETSANNRYPMFAVHSADFFYIFNPWSDNNTVFRNSSWGGITFKAMEKESATNEQIKERLNFFKYRTTEEFYDKRTDPDALNNLIDSEDYKQLVDKYRNDLLQWMVTYDCPAANALENHHDVLASKKFMEQQKEKVKQRLLKNKNNSN